MKDNYYRHISGVPYKMHCFIEMQFVAYFYTVGPYQALFRLPIFKNSAISKLGAIFFHFARYAISVPQLLKDTSGDIVMGIAGIIERPDMTFGVT